MQWLPEDNVLLLEIMACNMVDEEDSTCMDAATRWWDIVLQEFEYEQETSDNVLNVPFSPVLMSNLTINLNTN